MQFFEPTVASRIRCLKLSLRFRTKIHPEGTNKIFCIFSNVIIVTFMKYANEDDYCTPEKTAKVKNMAECNCNEHMKIINETYQQ